MDRLLPEEVRVVRLELGLSLREAARVTGLTKETLGDIERGVRNPHPQTLKRIADGYGVPVGRFLKKNPEEAISSPESPRESRFIWEPSPPRVPADILGSIVWEIRARVGIDPSTNLPDVSKLSDDSLFALERELGVYARILTYIRSGKPEDPIASALATRIDKITERVASERRRRYPPEQHWAWLEA